MDFSNFRTGLVSISFRKVAACDLIEEVVKAGQQGLEWGGDVHVPHGQTTKAEQVARWTRDAGLETAAYGSYYRLADEDSPEIEAVLDSAEALGAPTVRVWAGKKASEDADEAYRKAVVEDARVICALAAKRNLRIALEYHGNTLTDSIASAGELMTALDLENLDSLWQPPNGQPEDICEQSLTQLLPRISNVHVFHWGAGGFRERYPLAEGQERWARYFELLQAETKSRWALMEFVKDDTLAQYHADARSLHHILS
ncbi:TIM barrel protein [Kiritimatiellota bacterium B12222]|nr:TIM barrel protein [Kiritimatiellota bacterium B12222]